MTRANGPGVAGVPGSRERLDELGAWWAYSWSSAGGRDYCIPMYRSSDVRSCVDLKERMMTPGTMTDALLVLNEPYGQDKVNYRDQPSMIRRIVEEARDINPDCQCIVGNWRSPNQNIFSQHFIPTWQERYNLSFSEWAAEHKIYIGVHHYVWPETEQRKYDKNKWRDTLGDFWLLVKKLGCEGIVLTEWGCLHDGDLWKRVLADQSDWLNDMGFAHAVFLWGHDADEGFSMGVGDGPLTEYGEHYKRHCQKWRPN